MELYCKQMSSNSLWSMFFVLLQQIIASAVSSFDIIHNSISPLFTSIAPSQSCGPYQSYNKTYEVLEELLDQWNASEEKLVIKSIIKFIFSDVFQIYLLIILG